MAVDFTKLKKLEKHEPYFRFIWNMQIYRNSNSRLNPGLFRNFWSFYAELRKSGLEPITQFSEIIEVWELSELFQKYNITNLFPSDYWDYFEKVKGESIQARKGEKKWGLEIGVRYFPTKEHFPIIPFEDGSLVYAHMFNLISREEDENALNLFQKMEMVVLGGPANMKKNLGWMYKFWVAHTLPELHFFELRVENAPTQKALNDFWNSKEREGLESIFKRWVLLDGGLARRLRRAYRWHLLAYVRSVREEFFYFKFSRFHFILRFCIDFVLKRYRVK